MITIKEEKIAEMMFDIWHESDKLKNPVMVGEYIANKLKEAINYTHSCKSDSEQFNCYEMHAYSRFDGCNKQCKECADNEKSKAI